jgi:MFS family permease
MAADPLSPPAHDAPTVEGATVPVVGAGLPRFLRALSARNYRLFFCGQIISLVGTWMTQTASLWLAYHLERSALLLGAVGFAGQIPIFFLSLPAGVWVERMDKRKLLIGTQAASLIQSGALAGLTLTHHINIWSLIVLNVLQGVINAVDLPARQAFVIHLVDRREDLGNAIALNSSIFNLARLLGPAVGGLLIASVGAGYCYLIDAISYLAVIISLFRIVPRVSILAAQRAAEAALRAGRALQEFFGGLRYAFGFAPIGDTILLVAATAFTGFAAPVLMPILARDVFGGDARTLGWLMSATGTGALGGAIYLSTRLSVRGLGRVIALGGVAMGLGLIACGFCRTVAPALVCLVVTGAGGVLLMASSNTVVQSLVDDDKRARVMSLFAMAFTGTTPLGNLAIGALAGGRLGVRGALCLAGTSCALCAAIYLWRLPSLRAQAGPVLDRMEKV